MWGPKYGGQQALDFDETAQVVSEVPKTISRIEHSLQNAPQTILNRIYDIIGLDKIDDDILCNLVIARICQPQNKVSTVEYLKSHFAEVVKLHNI